MTSVETSLNREITHFLSNKLGFKRLNEIQNKAIPLILDKKDTLIISPTASGKTEAALIPIFNDILVNKLDSTSVLYIAPLKALINDMSLRIEQWTSYFYFSYTKWHGDVSRTAKDNFIRDPTDFLLITPESLEVIMMNRSEEDRLKIFGNIQYIIIDEIHYFVGSDRGIQLNSLISRLSKYVKGNLTKIGLSATVGNPELVAKWLNKDDPAEIVSSGHGRNVRYQVKHLDNRTILQTLSKHRMRKLLIFVLSRFEVEFYYSLIKRNLNIKNLYLHHASISKSKRENNEHEFKGNVNGIMISTSTLELGIDIGDINIAVQVEAPLSITSFLQRIGRSGRKTNNQMTIIFEVGLGSVIVLAEIILVKEYKIEDIEIPRNAKDILFHQILSSIVQYGKCNYKQLYDELSQAYVFSDISKSEYTRLLKHMDQLDLIDIEREDLTIGYNFEKEFGSRNFSEFFSVFPTSYDYTVKYGSRTIGTVDSTVVLKFTRNQSFVLSGNLWTIKDIDTNQYIIRVKPGVGDGDILRWGKGVMPLSSLISRKVYQILCGDYDESYLKGFDDYSRNNIKSAIEVGEDIGFREGIVPVEIKSNTISIYTFAGDKANILLLYVLKSFFKISSNDVNPFYLRFKTNQKVNFSDICYILNNIQDYLSNKIIEEKLSKVTSEYAKNKFIKYLPEEDRADVKMNVMFDKKSLVDVLDNNEPVLFDNIDFGTYFSDDEEWSRFSL